jgi:hypothetical protein
MNLWNGRKISRGEVSEFRNEVERRILERLFQNPSDFEQMAAQLAWVGSTGADRTLLAKDIQALDFSKSDLIIQAGLGKTLSKFWKKHKKEILIGIAALAVITVVVVVTVSTAGAVAGGAAAAGGAALDSLKKKEDEPDSKEPQKDPPAASPPPPNPVAEKPVQRLTPSPAVGRSFLERKEF